MGEESRPNRKSIRLQSFDYSRNGAYFVTICTHQRQMLFGLPGMPRVALKKTEFVADSLTKNHHREGEIYTYSQEQTIAKGEGVLVKQTPCNVGALPCVRPRQAIAMIENWFEKIETKYNGVWVDSYVVMPDHVHAILMIHRGLDVTGAHTGAPLHNQTTKSEQSETRDSKVVCSDLGEIVKWFKTMTTNAYIQGVKQGIYQPFDFGLWQRNYYEHIIRDEDDLYEIRRYISENPARFAIDGKEPF